MLSLLLLLLLLLLAAVRFRMTLFWFIITGFVKTETFIIFLFLWISKYYYFKFSIQYGFLQK